jgi:hypothetical protein
LGAWPSSPYRFYDVADPELFRVAADARGDQERDAGPARTPAQGRVGKVQAAHKAYPQTADFVDVGNLQKDLVGGGYLAEIPSDPLSAGGKKYLYISNGTVIAMLFDLEAGPNGTPPAGTCVSRVKADIASFKKYGPDCPF